MKAISRIYQPDNVDILKFSFKISNLKKFKLFNDINKKESLEFIDDCMNDLQIFRNKIISLDKKERVIPYVPENERSKLQEGVDNQ